MSGSNTRAQRCSSIVPDRSLILRSNASSDTIPGVQCVLCVVCWILVNLDVSVCVARTQKQTAGDIHHHMRTHGQSSSQRRRSDATKHQTQVDPVLCAGIVET